ncbi:MAG TPA: hypothetical protein VGK25_00395, partial [Ignavibacteria bacterium]
MKTTITLFLALITSTNIYSQWGWVEQTSGVTVQLTSVSSTPNYETSQSAWICGYSGTVLKTTNRGVNWINVSGNGIPATVSLINIVRVNDNTALTAGYISS